MSQLNKLYKEAVANQKRVSYDSEQAKRQEQKKQQFAPNWNEQAENRTWHPDYPGLGALFRREEIDPNTDEHDLQFMVSPQGSGGPGYSKWDADAGATPPKWNGTITNWDTPIYESEGQDPYELAQHLDQWYGRNR